MNDIQQREIQYGDTIIKYTLVFSNRKLLTIEVQPDMSVLVKAPSGTIDEKIEEKLQKRASWIAKQIRFFDSIRKNDTEKTYVSGETFLYLGKQYRLKLIETKNNTVKLSGGYFWIETTDKNNTLKISKLMEAWYQIHAKKKFAERIEKYYDLIKKEVLNKPAFELRKMKTRWGSCTPQGKIILNIELIKAPVYCIDYVIVHELAHLIEHNHSPKFYQLKTRLMPDWKERKKRLEGLEIG